MANRSDDQRGALLAGIGGALVLLGLLRLFQFEVGRTSRGSPFSFLMLHPMMGGIPPAAAWESLRLFERGVLPNV